MDYEPETSEYAVTCLFVLIIVIIAAALVLERIMGT